MTDNKAKISAVIAAAGNSSRMGFNKLFAKVGTSDVISLSIRKLANNTRISEIVVVTQPNYHSHIKEVCEKECAGKPFKIVFGANTRQESVFNGIRACDEKSELFVIHDGARPFVTDEEICAVIEDAIEFGAATLAVPVKDTVKVVDSTGVITSTPDRSTLYAAQTPQVFKAEIYKTAMNKCQNLYTDDCALVESIGQKIKITVGKYSNVKITTVEDLRPTEAVMRLGHGYDVHRLVENRKLILGGVCIPYEKGLLGHSDADVLVHSIMDSILGALALGDIGKLFPDNDPAFKDIDSMLLLARVYEKMSEKGYRIGNLDCTVVAQAPKLSPFIPEMRENVSRALHCDVSAVNIKATTEEKLGFTGSGEGISAHAVVLLTKEENL